MPCSAVVIGGYYAYDYIYLDINSIDQHKQDALLNEDLIIQHNLLSTLNNLRKNKNSDINKAQGEKTDLTHNLLDLNKQFIDIQEEINLLKASISDKASLIEKAKKALELKNSEKTLNQEEEAALLTEINQFVVDIQQQMIVFNKDSQNKLKDEEAIEVLVNKEKDLVLEKFTKDKSVSDKEKEITAQEASIAEHMILENAATKNKINSGVTQTELADALDLYNKETKDPAEAADTLQGRIVTTLKTNQDTHIKEKIEAEKAKNLAEQKENDSKKECEAIWAKAPTTSNANCEVPPEAGARENQDVKTARSAYWALRRATVATVTNLKTATLNLTNTQTKLAAAIISKESTDSAFKAYQTKTEQLQQELEEATADAEAKLEEQTKVKVITTFLTEALNTLTAELPTLKALALESQKAIDAVKALLVEANKKALQSTATYNKTKQALELIQSNKSSKEISLANNKEARKTIVKNIHEQTLDISDKEFIKDAAQEIYLNKEENLKSLILSIPKAEKFLLAKTPEINALTSELESIKTQIKSLKSEILKNKPQPD